MIDLTVHEESLARTVRRAKERNILLPTFAEMKHPETLPEEIKERLAKAGLWDIDSINLFRVTWKNEPASSGGLFGNVNALEIPSELTGVPARIVGLVGKWFPTGAHKVGASYACLVPRLITGQFDPTANKAVWPSTGNYCRGGAYDAHLLACESVAILPEGMSRERFEWLATVAGEVIPTPGSESNVKEIFDKTWELRRERDDVVVFNQFEEFGNHLWHYEITGSAMEEVFQSLRGKGDRFAGVVLTSGSGGTLGSADYIKERYPGAKLAVGEALQCPTLLANGYGAHRIEGIGDKHVPWIHNVRNTDMVIAIDDDDCMKLLRLFNEPKGREFLKKQGISPSLVDQLDLLGISSLGNLIGAIKFAKYYQLTEQDVVFTVFTDSMELYTSRVVELQEAQGEYDELQSAADFRGSLQKLTLDWMEELRFYDRKRIHDLKYYTWVEQQGRSIEELNAQWYDWENYWGEVHRITPKIDALIREFNRRVMAE
ncbi:MAG TPA: pyridoxal-phosphate dependent enzyme [Synergistaceae bacterium]|nr:pyridoxal-phosphate dependent enzyme [Synergistaceae bacterium]HPJ26126.1 pyridoxal-phosphate dependent enzyme [Synergistaceae bacterium]HPQ36621.1 pyridoxal-phosphate dependent enzyme [Synergistaceae bacterium]